MFKDRLKTLRKDLEITQEKFAKRIGLSRTAYAKYEYGDVDPSELLIKAISSEFDVNETWLRKGQGEIYSRGESIEFAKLLGELAADNDETKRELISDINKLDNDDLLAIKTIVNSLTKKR